MEAFGSCQEKDLCLWKRNSFLTLHSFYSLSQHLSNFSLSPSMWAIILLVLLMQRMGHTYCFTSSPSFSLLSPSSTPCQSTPHSSSLRKRFSKVTKELCLCRTLLRHNPLGSICSTCQANRLLLMVQKEKSKLATILFLKAQRGS